MLNLIKCNCLNCNSIFEVMPHDIGEGKRNQKFCSGKCRGQHKSKQFGYPEINRKCKNCRKDFIVEKPCRKTECCSKSCAGEYRKTQNNEIKQKIIPEMKEYRKTHTAKETGDKFGMSASGIQQWGIVGPEMEKRLTCPNELTQEQHEFMVGNLLGDGSLSWLKSSERNSHFAISQKQGFSEYVKALYEIYMPFSLGYYERETKKPSRINGKINHEDEHWDGTFLMKSAMYTVAHPVFTNYRKKWYHNPCEKRSRKIIPRDLKLTWRIAAIWMCDDGSNHCRIKYHQRYLMLHTESFSDEDVEFLIRRLQEDLGIKATLNRHDGKPTIRIGGDDWYSFIENIKTYVPWECFKYKCVNRKKINRNKSGFIGVIKSGKKWKAFKSFRVKGKFKSVEIGLFHSPEEANVAREKWLMENYNYRQGLQ